MSTGSLREAYSLAHTAQCRLNIEAGRPDRNLRFVVGHLMHYESLRLRIVEIEHDISRSHRNANVTFKGTGHYNLQNKPSPGQLRKSPPPPPETSRDEPDDDDDDSSDSDDLPEDFLFDDEEDDSLCGLGLQRFPSGSARPSNPPPELVPDNPADDDEDEDDPPSPPDKETLDEYVQGDGNVAIAKLYNRMHKCHCHGKTDDTPEFQRMWKLPPDKDQSVKNGMKTLRAVAQVA